MKSMNNDNSSSNNNNNNSNWLGFCLSPHMNMEASSEPQPPASAAVVSTALPTSSFHSSPSSHINYSSICYGVGSENGAFYSPLSVMPLKSDGSLCLMEALTRSQQQGMVTTSTPTPKLEDFFGGATMGTHQYESNGREAMALSLDSMYYHQTSEHESNSHNFLNNLQQNSRQQQQQIEAQYYPFYSGYRSHEIFQTPLEEQNKETQVADCNVQQHATADDGISEMNNWVSRNYSVNPTLEQKRIDCMGTNGGESGSIGAMGYGDLQSLSLSMSPGSQTSCVTGSQLISPSVTDCVAMDARKRGSDKVDQKQIVHRKSIDTFGQRTSQYRGVTRHRWTGRYEAHLWDNSCKKEGQSRKGRQG